MTDTPRDTLTLTRAEAERRGLKDGDIVALPFARTCGPAKKTLLHVVRVVESLDEPQTLFSDQQGNQPR